MNRKLLLLVFLLLPNICFAEKIKSSLYLIEYFDSEGIVGVESAPTTLPHKVNIDWNLKRNRITGKFTLKVPGNRKPLNCTTKSNTLTCPLQTSFVHDLLGGCVLKQKHIIRVGTKGSTATISQNLNCPQYPYGAVTKYIGIVGLVD